MLSGLATGASWLCFYRALQLGDMRNRVVPIDKSSTVMTMLLALIFLGEGLTFGKAVCMAAIAAGTLLMIRRAPASAGEPPKRAAGTVYALLSAVFASLTSLLAKVGIAEIDSNLGTAVRTTVVLITAWAIVFARKKQRELRACDARTLAFRAVRVCDRRVLALLLPRPAARPGQRGRAHRQTQPARHGRMRLPAVPGTAGEARLAGAGPDYRGYGRNGVSVRRTPCIFPAMSGKI